MEQTLAQEATGSGEAIDRQIDAESVREFGGPIGVATIMAGSHVVMFYLWIAWRFHDGALPYPRGLSDLLPFLGRMWGHVAADAAPTWQGYDAQLYGVTMQSQVPLSHRGIGLYQPDLVYALTGARCAVRRMMDESAT